MTTGAGRSLGGPRAYAIWAAAVTAYVVAVFQRTSFGVAGLAASDRFGASASVLAGFAVLQLLVYAGLQVPVGVLLDRLGSRRLVVAGALIMAAGQLVLAVAAQVPTAALGRLLVGTGDALTFISVLRLVPAWFPARRIPVITQFTGLLGQIGQLLSAIPLVALLAGPGWTTAFGSAAALGVLAAALALIGVRDAPHPEAHRYAAKTLRQVGHDLAVAWRHPGTRLGLWTHFSTQFSGTTFVLLWGYPYLVSAQGVSPARASGLLTVFVVAGVATAPVLGVLVARHPLRRSWLVLGIVGVTALTWTVLLSVPGPAPGWLLVVLMLALALGGPASMIGFDYARSFNPPNRLGTATGIVNVGGFVASLLAILLVGLVLDLLTAGGSTRYGREAFRAAWAVQYLLWALGVTGILLARRKVRRRLAAEGVVVPPIREVLRRRRQARAGRRG